ncbi:MAG: hypothetical protein OXC62_10695 [Aestuariivita sp.]|nr:hypothetical protein [Aestuariivita sp.]
MEKNSPPAVGRGKRLGSRSVEYIASSSRELSCHPRFLRDPQARHSSQRPCRRSTAHMKAPEDGGHCHQIAALTGENTKTGLLLNSIDHCHDLEHQTAL